MAKYKLRNFAISPLFNFAVSSAVKVQPSALIATYFIALTAAMTWPQAVSLHSVPSHHDVLFSIWRLAWINHALTERVPLFNANIFHPVQTTLAYSDAMLLQGLFATGLMQLGVPAVAAYNVLVLASFVACGGGAYLWARSLGVSRLGGVVAGTIFSVAPMRFGHYMHLEILWTQWIPLALWSCRRLVDVGDARSALLLGAFMTLQALSGLYAFMFLSITVPIYLAAMVVFERRFPRGRTLLYVAMVAVPSMAIVGAYAQPFMANAAMLGSRSAVDVREYSATAASFFAAPSENWLYSWTSSWGGRELELSAGVVPLILAVLAFRGASPRLWSAMVVMLLGVAVTLGSNGPVFGFLREYVFGFNGLRVPARAAMIAHCGLAVTAAAGFDQLRRNLSANATRAAVVVVLSALVAEYWSRTGFHQLPREPSAYASWVATQPDQVIAEFPMPTLSTLPGEDANFQYESIHHWRKLVNGYSGYYPMAYLELVHACESWSDACKTALRDRGVRTMTVHLADTSGSASRATVAAFEQDTTLEAVLTTRATFDLVRIYRFRTDQ